MTVNLQTTVRGPLDPAVLSTSSQKVIIRISKPMVHLILHHNSLQPCMSFIPYALVFGVHWTPMEVEVWFIFYSSMKVNIQHGVIRIIIDLEIFVQM